MNVPCGNIILQRKCGNGWLDKPCKKWFPALDKMKIRHGFVGNNLVSFHKPQPVRSGSVRYHGPGAIPAGQVKKGKQHEDWFN